MLVALHAQVHLARAVAVRVDNATADADVLLRSAGGGLSLATGHLDLEQFEVEGAQLERAVERAFGRVGVQHQRSDLLSVAAAGFVGARAGLQLHELGASLERRFDRVRHQTHDLAPVRVVALGVALGIASASTAGSRGAASSSRTTAGTATAGFAKQTATQQPRGAQEQGDSQLQVVE